MKNPALIIATVAGYSLLATALLLIFLLPEEYGNSGHAFVGFAQFLIIPGMAALFSLILHGRNHWKRRMLVILLVGTVGIPVAFFVGVFPLVLIFWAYDANVALFIVLLPAVIAVMAWLLMLAIRRTSQLGVKHEAARWLADRHANSDAHRRRQQNRAIRLALWIPSMLVLAVFSFLPEMWGVLTHINQSRAGELFGYDVAIPATGVIVGGYKDKDGASSVSGVVAHGMGVDLKGYFHLRNLSLSTWSVGTKEAPEAVEETPSNRNEPSVRRDFQIGTAVLACFGHDLPREGQVRTGAEPLAMIECSGPARLRASFMGEKVNVPVFYRMIAGITPALPR